MCLYESCTIITIELWISKELSADISKDLRVNISEELCVEPHVSSMWKMFHFKRSPGEAYQVMCKTPATPVWKVWQGICS